MVFEQVLSDKWYVDLSNKLDQTIQSAYLKNEALYAYILKYTKNNNLLVSSVELLVDNNAHVNYNKAIQIFSLDPTNTATDLFKLLCKTKGRDFSMNIDAVDIHYSIDYLTRPLVKISKINQYKEVSLMDFILPLNINNIYVLPPILELIDLYKQLYNPENVDNWCDIIYKSEKIRAITNQNINNTINIKKGGKCVTCKQKTDINISACKSCKDKRNMQVDEVKDILIDFLSTYGDYVAIHKFHESPLKGKNVEILSKNDISTDFERLYMFINKLSADNKTIMFKKKNMFIGKDLRIIKHTFYLTMSKYNNQWSIVKKPFLDIYNNCSYELIPYELHKIDNKTIKFAHTWVQARFYYIEIWNILAAYKLDILNDAQTSTYINDILEHVNNIKISITDIPRNYTGLYINEYQSFKKIILKKGKSSKIYC